MGAGIAVDPILAPPRTIPTTGMRGGLGRTLLTAFLILTIMPLAAIGGYAVWQNRRSLEEGVAQKLQAVATLKAQVVTLWWKEQMAPLALADIDNVGDALLPVENWERLQHQAPGLVGLARMNGRDEFLWSVGVCATLPQPLIEISTLSAHDTLVLSERQLRSTVLTCHRWGLGHALDTSEEVLGESGRVYLVQLAELEAHHSHVVSPALEALAVGGSGNGVYENHRGVRVIGAYQPLVVGGLGILVEQDLAEVLASNEEMAATLIGVILVMVLMTTFIAAIMIRKITQPVTRLTESALAMAEGDLAQSVVVTSRDEIGILTYVFNQMAADLKSLYDDLEAKVVQRTQLLQRANYQIQRRALQLEASLKVSEAVTSLRAPERLLSRVVGLIADRFIFSSVAVYLSAPGGGEAHLHAEGPTPGHWPAVLHPGDGSVMERALRKDGPQVEHWQILQEERWSRRTVSRVAVPLKMEARNIGVLAVLNTERESIEDDDLEVLVHVANQIAVALENARAYERERLAAQRLEETEVFKSHFLANMSHTLREPLNSIVGFSRLMLKGLDGPLTEQQLQDLQRIHENSQRLLERINDILTTSQIQAGLMELQLQPVDLAEIAEAVIPTAEAMVRGKPVQLIWELASDLPFVHADATRVRQVLIHLLSNAAKFTARGEIVVRMWADGELAYVSVRDTGIGINAEDCERIFERFDTGSAGRLAASGAGLGLALSKEFIEMHGGQIWMRSAVGAGSTFTLSLPLYVPEFAGRDT